MGITYEEESAPKPKVTYEERRKPAPEMSFLDRILRAAKPDIFTDVGYEVGANVTDATGSPALGTAANVATSFLPSMVLGAGSGTIAGEVGKKVAQRTMQSAIRPTLGDLEAGKAQKAVEFMLREGVNPTEGGIASLRAQGLELANQVKSVLANKQVMVPTANAENALLKLASELEGGTLGVQRSQEVMGVLRSFLNHPSLGGGKNMAIQDAQRMKQLNYKELDDAAYGIGVKPAAEAQSLKDITRVLKTEIEKAAPEVVPLNARQSEIWNAIKVAERRSLLDGNKNPVSLGTSIAMATHNPGLTLGMWLNSSAWGKSMIARGIFSASELGAPLGALAGTAGVLSSDPQRGVLSSR